MKTMATPSPSIAFGQVSSCLVAVLCFGGAINLLTSYEWMPFRCIDLYSWAPASETAYRPYWHAPYFFLPIDFSVPTQMDYKDLPGLPVYTNATPRATTQLDMVKNYPSHSFEATLRKRIQEGGQYSLRKNTTRIDFHIVEVYVVVEPSQTHISWHEYCFDSTAPRVTIRCYSSFRSMHQQLQGMTGGTPYRGRGFATSVLYWCFMFVPVAMLAADIQLPGTRRPARRALFTAFPSTLVHLKVWLWDNAVLVYIVGQAKSLDAWSLAAWSDWALFSLTFASMLVSGLLRGRSLRRKPGSAVLWLVNLHYRLWMLAAMSFAIRDYETNKNLIFPSMYAALFAQSLAVSILADLLVRLGTPAQQSESSVLTRDEIESGLIKFVAATFFYSAGATKLGACGLKWIDDRYIVQLALRGRLSRDGPFPLETLILSVPPSIRDIGMASVLIMELSSVYAWYSFGNYVLLWFIFMTGSTLTIGVPLHPSSFGALRPLADWSIGPLLESRIGGPLVLLVLIATLLLAIIRTRRTASGRKSK